MGKKVCVLTSVHPVFDTRIFHKQARSLVKAGYDVTLIAQHDKNEVVDGVTLLALPKARNRLRRMLGTWRVFRLARSQRAEIYHLHDPELLPVGMLLKLLTKAQVVYDVHEDYPKDILTKYWIPLMARRPISALFNILEKWMAHRLDLIIAATDDIALRFRKQKTIVVHNYPLAQEIGPISGRDFRSGVVIYAGVLSKERGIGEAVKAIENVKSSRTVKLLLCGRFSPESYEDEVRGLRGFERVEFLGWLEAPDAWRKMAQAEVGIVCFHPMDNHVNAMPNKLFEYMAAGLPVVASNFPLWKSIVEGNNCGLTVDPVNPNEIAKAIEYLIDHPTEASMMGENGRNAVMEKYNWEMETGKLLAIYHDLPERGD